MSIPAVEAGLDLDQRVVRRHVAKLEAAGWLARASWVWGEGSVVWLTAAGVEGAGLGGVRAVKSPPAPTTIAHGVLVGWSAARAEHRGHVWKSARELAPEPDRWAVRARCERGYTQLLPDLAVWPEGWESPGAVIAESGGRREDRQKLILEGWRDATWSGRYHAVRYDCASESVAAWIARLARKIGLTDSQFTADVQTTAEQIAAPSPAAVTTEPALEMPALSPKAEPASDEPSQPAPAGGPTSQEPHGSTTAEPAPLREPDTADASVERECIYREVLGARRCSLSDCAAPRHHDPTVGWLSSSGVTSLRFCPPRTAQAQSRYPQRPTTATTTGLMLKRSQRAARSRPPAGAGSCYRPRCARTGSRDAMPRSAAADSRDTEPTTAATTQCGSGPEPSVYAEAEHLPDQL